MGASRDVGEERIPPALGKQNGAILSGHQILSVGVDDEMLPMKDPIELPQIDRKLMRSTGFIRFDGLFNLQCGGVHKQILARGSQGNKYRNHDKRSQRENQNSEAPQE